MRGTHRAGTKALDPLRYRYPVQIAGCHDLSAERRSRLFQHPGSRTAVIALREVRQDEETDSGFFGDTAGLGRGEVPELRREALVRGGEGGLADQHVGALGELEGGVAEPCIHDERELLATAEFADLLETHRSVPRYEDPVPDEVADVGAVDAVRGEAVREHATAVRLG